MNSFGEKRYGCSVCGKFTDRKPYYNTAEFHSGEKPYKCQWCEHCWALLFYARKRFYISLSRWHASKIAVSQFCAFLVKWKVKWPWSCELFQICF